MAGRQPIVQHAEQPLVQIREWVMKRLKHLLGFDEVDGLVDNLMKLQSAEEIEKYIKDILGTERKAVQKFTEDLIQKRKDASPLFRTVPIRKLSTAGPPGQGSSEPNVKVYRKKDEVDPYMVKKKKKPANKPKDQGASPPAPHAGQAQTGGGKKKGGKQQGGDSLQLPGRAWCGCMAARHPLLGNCLYCGKIVCAQEGAGPCLFCGNAVGEAPGAGSISLSKQEADAEYDASLARALEHKDKLLEYERTSARRTVIYDDQQDYFQTDGSQWMTPEQRKQMKKLEEERRKQREDAKNKVSISFDFAGRRVMVDQGAAMDDAYFFEKADDISRGVLQNPTLRRPAPVFTAADERPGAKGGGGSSKATGKATADHAANKEKDEDEYNRKLQQRASKRVQHDYYAIDSEWTPEDAPTTSSSSSSSSSSSAASSAAPTASQRSFKFRGLCERAFDYAPLYPSAAFHRWSADDRRTVISTLRQTSGLTAYLYVVDATAASGGDAELARVGQLAEVCAREGVELVYGLSFPAAFFTGAALEKDKVREQVDKLRVVERMVTLSSTGAGAGAVTRFAFFFDDAPAPHLPSTTSPTMLGSAGGKTSLLSSLHAYVANHLLDETRKRAKQAAAALEFFLLPLFYGKDVKENRSGGAGGNGPKQTPSFGTQPHKKEQEAEMDRDVVQYWKEMDRNTRPDFTFLFSGFTSIEPRAPRGSSAAPSAAAAAAAALDGISLGRLRELVQQHKVVLLDTYPSLVPTFKSTTVPAKATTTTTASASASLVRSFPAITHLQGYEASAHAAAAEWADGLAVQVASALVPPHAGLVPLLTAFDFMLAPHTHDPTIALKSALLRLLQGEERLADELLGLIDATPSASSSLAIRRFKIKKLATPTFFHETADRMSYVRKSLSSTSAPATAAGSGGVALGRLGEELRPFFVLLDTFLDMNAINFELEAFFEKQKQTKHAGAGGGQKWDEFGELKKRLTEVERKLDVLLAPAYPLSTLKHNQRDLNTAYLEG